jgi:predicted aspartyl protease
MQPIGLEVSMETQAMERITVRAKIESLRDLCLVEHQILPTELARFVEIDDALVDADEAMLMMPKNLIDRLGLQPTGTRNSRKSSEPVRVQIYDPVRLTIDGRDCVANVAGLPEGEPVLIGRIPLALLDFVVDPQGRKLIGNPAHGGEPMIEMYRCVDHESPGIASAASIGECRRKVD